MHTKLPSDEEFTWREWVMTPEKAKGKIKEIICYTQENTESIEYVRNRFNEIRITKLAIIEQQLKFVKCLVAAAPLLGLLGTVLGMLQTFFGIATSSGVETAAVVASGISEALVTTETGLTIALPALFMVMFIQRQNHQEEAKLARLESLTLTCLNLGMKNSTPT
ncbi:MAG: MotA/TolQ/ExbB proton channel family protein [Verrucomicrobiota bacterium]|nr:MotA/TolQ/ExbB proton channel family protein [Verrucomicrobiota bacterium]